MISYGCIICDDIVVEKNTMCSSCEEAYEKGVRDMFEATRKECNCFCVEIFVCNDGCEQELETCTENNNFCDFNKCPIAKKLLKAVK